MPSHLLYNDVTGQEEGEEDSEEEEAVGPALLGAPRHYAPGTKHIFINVGICFEILGLMIITKTMKINTILNTATTIL